MRFFLILALIAQLAVPFVVALPIVPISSISAIQDGSLNNHDAVLLRRAVMSASWLKSWKSKPATTTSVKLGADASPAPASQSSSSSSQSTSAQTKSTENLNSGASSDHIAMQTKTKNQMMADAYTYRAALELARARQVSRQSWQQTKKMTQMDVERAKLAFRFRNMRQGITHARAVARKGAIGASYATVPLINGYRYAAKAQGTAMKYRVKQWTGSRKSYVSDPNAAVNKASGVYNYAPGFQRSQDYLGKMWGRPRPAVPVDSQMPRLAMGTPTGVPVGPPMG